MKTVLYYIFYSLCFLLSLLPFWVLYLISDFFYFIVYHCVGYRKKVVRKNLTESFPEKTKEEILAIEKEYYSFFCDYVVETLKLISISKKSMLKHMRFENLDELKQDLNKGRNVAVYLGHYCNWEWGSSLPLSLPKDIMGGQIYHKLRNEVSDRIFLKLRGRMGAESIPMKETARRLVLMRREKKPVVIGFIADQSPKWVNIHHWTDFLNHETPVFTGTERLAKQLDMSVYYVDMSRLKRGYYVGKFIKLTDDPKSFPDYEITDMYMKRLEETIRRAPQYWLWSHKRWKRTREEFDALFEMTPDGRVRKRENAKDM